MFCDRVQRNHICFISRTVYVRSVRCVHDNSINYKTNGSRRLGFFRYHRLVHVYHVGSFEPAKMKLATEAIGRLSELKVPSITYQDIETSKIRGAAAEIAKIAVH